MDIKYTKTPFLATSYTRASCILSPASGTNVTGQLFLETANGGVRVYGYVDGLAAGSSHGFHIHQYGDITNSTGANAGGHYNPNNVVSWFVGLSDVHPIISFFIEFATESKQLITFEI